MNGLLWSHISPEGILTTTTTKTGAVVEFDTNELLDAMLEINRIPLQLGTGPVIIDEAAGRPYAENRFQQEWRKIADAAEVPRSLKTMDGRAGDATEAGAAGASLSDIRPVMGHSDARTTTRYVRGTSLEQQRRVSKMRREYQSQKSSPDSVSS